MTLTRLRLLRSEHHCFTPSISLHQEYIQADCTAFQLELPFQREESMNHRARLDFLEQSR